MDAKSVDPIFILPVLCQCDYPAETFNISINDRIYKFEELFESVKKIDSIQAFVAMLGVASCLQWNGMVSATRVLNICSAQNEHHELITMLHTDQMMASGYGYPPRYKIDGKDRRVFHTQVAARNPESIVVHETGPNISMHAQSFQIAFDIEVYLHQNALSNKVFANFSTESRIFNDQAPRVPLNRILLLANRIGCFAAESVPLMDAIVELGSFDMGLVGLVFPPIDQLMSRALVDVEEHTALQANGDAIVSDDYPQLLSHQKQNVLWMLAQEQKTLGGDLWYPFSKINYCDVQYCPCMQLFRVAPRASEGVSNRYGGGMLMDDTGMGKTRSLLGLCSATPGTSLVVVPLSVLSQWKDEAEKLQLKVYLYYGATRIRDIKKLAEYSVIISTFTVLSRDFSALEKHCKALEDELREQMQEQTSDTVAPVIDASIKTIFGMPFTRVIVDESHKMCANTRNALEKVQTKNRWCATATPGSQPTALLRQLSFLSLGIPTTQTYMTQNLLIGSRLHSRLGYLLKCISRRHTKEQLDNPPAINVRNHKHYVEMSADDVDKYTTLLTRKRLSILTLSHRGAHALVHFNELRSHMSSASFTDTNFSQLPPLHPEPEAILQAIRNEQCAVCLDPFDAPVVTLCGHKFCLSCIRTVMSSRANCPLCREQIQWSSLQLLSTPVHDNVPANSKLFEIVRKITALNEKVLVFSEFQSTLRILKQLLDESNIRTFVIEGRMSRHARDRSLREFHESGGQSAFLLNLKTAGTGLNLQSSKCIIFCEPLISTTLRNQAIGRISRIGQRSNVIDVHTFMLQNTIEEKIEDALEQNPTWRPTVPQLRRILHPNAMLNSPILTDS